MSDSAIDKGLEIGTCSKERVRISTTKFCFFSYITNIFVTIIIGVEIAVDKLSNSMINNFLIFFVDKTYTLVVYLSTR